MGSSNRGFTLIELLIVVAIIGIIAAIAIPSLLRARISANESAAVGDIRAIISAEAAYHQASGGYYGAPTCLSEPWQSGCINSYPTNAPTFIDANLAALTAKTGYDRTFNGTAITGGYACYVYHTDPTQVGKTGVRAFAGDCSGRLCYSGDGTPVPEAGGYMVNGCPQIQ